MICCQQSWHGDVLRICVKLEDREIAALHAVHRVAIIFTVVLTAIVALYREKYYINDCKRACTDHELPVTLVQCVF